MEKILLQRLGYRIRNLRERKGCTQTVFSGMCDLHKSHMGQIERGQINLTFESLLKISRALNISLSKLFMGVDDNHAKTGGHS